MARDPEVDRLKSIQDNCFEIKQKAYKKQSDLWNDVSKLSARIEYAKQRQQQLYGLMKDCFERASAAHNSKDFTNAKINASQGHDYKYQNQQAVSELRSLIAEVKILRNAQKRALDEFRSAKARFDRASSEFQARLELVKAKNQRERDERKDIARRAGVPNQYIDNIWVKKGSDGITNIFFGGYGKPDGPGHGHYTIDTNGKVGYERNPWEQHGSQNFTDSKRDYFSIVIQEASISGDFGFNCQFRGHSAYAESNVNKEGRKKIDIYYGPNGPFGAGHNHAVAYRETPTEIIYDGIRS